MKEEYYYEYDPTTRMIGVYHVEKDGDRAADAFPPEEFEEIHRRYPTAISKEFYEFLQEVDEDGR